MGEHRKRRGVRLLIVAIALLAGALLFEAGVTAWLHLLASDEQFRRYASREQIRARAARRGETAAIRFEPHRYIGYVPAAGFRNGDDFHNDLGFRGEPFPARKPAGEIRIFCLGGSTTYTSAVSNAMHSYPALLQAELRRRGHQRVRVVNAGVPGYTSYETLLTYFLRVADLQPDVLIVYQGINDACARMVWPPEAYRGDNSGWIAAGGPLFEATPPLQRWNTLRILLLHLGRIPRADDLLQQVRPMVPTAMWFYYVWQHEHGTYPEGVFEVTPAREMLARNPPVHFRRNLEALVAAARADGAQTVLATFAVNDRMDDWSADGDMVLAVGEQNEVVKEVGRDLGAPVFDYAAVAPADVDGYADGVHVDEQGARLKAARFADFLERSVLPQSRAVLEARFQASERSLLRLDPSTGFAGIVPIGETKTEPAGAAMRIPAGRRPRRVQLPRFRPPPEGSAALLRVEVDSPADGRLRLFWATPDQPRYDRRRSTVRRLVAGRNEVYLSLQDAPDARRLRIDLAGGDGFFLLRSVEIRAVVAR